MRPRPSGVRLDGEVTVIAGEAVDQPALHALQDLLDEYGLRSRVLREPVADFRRPLVVLGGPTETPASVEALKALGVAGPEGLPPLRATSWSPAETTTDERASCCPVSTAPAPSTPFSRFASC
jgi:hypothetical protein